MGFKDDVLEGDGIEPTWKRAEQRLTPAQYRALEANATLVARQVQVLGRLEAKGLTAQEPVVSALDAQERLILEATETICWLLDKQQVNRAELARRLGRREREVCALLRGEKTMTLRMLANMGHALGHEFTLIAHRSQP